jgi:hypothetical protein
LNKEIAENTKIKKKQKTDLNRRKRSQQRLKEGKDTELRQGKDSLLPPLASVQAGFSELSRRVSHTKAAETDFEQRDRGEHKDTESRKRIWTGGNGANGANRDSLFPAVSQTTGGYQEFNRRKP